MRITGQLFGLKVADLIKKGMILTTDYCNVLNTHHKDI